MGIQNTPNLLGGGGWGAIRVLLPTMSGSEVTDWDGDQVDLTLLTNVKPEFANKRKSTEYESVTTVKGVNVRVAKVDKTQDAITGEIVAAEGQASSLEFTFAGNTAIFEKIEAAYDDPNQPMIVIWGDGEVDGGLARDFHLMGFVDGNFSREMVQGVEVATVKVVGGVGFTEDDSNHTGYIGAYKTTPGTITPDGSDDAADAITLTDVTSPNVTTLLSGEFVKVTRV